MRDNRLKRIELGDPNRQDAAGVFNDRGSRINVNYRPGPAHDVCPVCAPVPLEGTPLAPKRRSSSP